MAWYATGTVTLTNGARVVAGAGTQWISALIRPGDAFIAAGGAPLEIESVDSATQLTLRRPWLGATAGGVEYAIQPTQENVGELARQTANLLLTFTTIRDTIGQGMFAGGGNAAPGVRFTADQDTGLTNPVQNAIGFVTGGVERARLNGDGLIVSNAPIVANGANQITARVRITNGTAGKSYDLVSGVTNASETGFSIFDVASGQTRMTIADGGLVGIGTFGPEARLDVRGNALISTGAVNILGFGRAEGLTGAPTPNARGGNAFIVGGNLDNGGNGAPSYLAFHTAAGGVVSEWVRIDPLGNIVVGSTSSPAGHLLRKGLGQGGEILRVDNGAMESLIAYAAGARGYSTAPAAIAIGRNDSTGRAVNAGGTINASGADYAEYMTKADGCGAIAKGEVCGVDADGKLTRKWADARSFVVKSTDPSLVGGDVWGAAVGPRPTAPVAPIAPDEDGDDEGRGAYAEKVVRHDAENDQYEADLAAWEAAHEAARRCVDRIAFSGQVPCLVDGEFEVGDYIVAAANGGGIKAVAIAPAEMTLPLYFRRIGKVWAARDGKAWIDVQHG